MSSRKDFETWGCSDRDLSITLKCETYAGIAWLAWQAATKAMEAKCAALAAENAGLKAALNPEVIPDAAVEAFTETAIMDQDWNDTGEYSWVENDTDVIRAVLEAIKPETPATESFLAEVRAQGVEMFGQYHNFSEKLFIQKEAKKFAAQLRKGVQS